MLVMQGLILMVVGISIVWLFLGVLVLVIKASGMIVPRFSHILPDDEPAAQAPADAPPTQDEAAAVAIAIAAAAMETRRGGGGS